jgi:cytochrome oxidase assembly protein ShyY1
VLRTLATGRWIALTAVAVLAIAAFGAMSYWQWQRAQRDQAIPRQPVPVEQVLVSTAVIADADFGRPVVVSGTWDPEHQVLVDHGDVYWVVTPVQPATGPAVPVARGTVSSPDAAGVLPAPSGPVVVEGLAQPYEGDPGTDDPSADGITTRLTEAGLALPYEAVKGWVALTAQQPSPAVALEPVVAPFGGEGTSTLRLQNAGYAVQWVAFALFVVFIWWRWLREESRDPDRQAAPAPVPSRPEIY